MGPFNLSRLVARIILNNKYVHHHHYNPFGRVAWWKPVLDALYNFIPFTQVLNAAHQQHVLSAMLPKEKKTVWDAFVTSTYIFYQFSTVKSFICGTNSIYSPPCSLKTGFRCRTNYLYSLPCSLKTDFRWGTIHYFHVKSIFYFQKSFICSIYTLPCSLKTGFKCVVVTSTYIYN